MASAASFALAVDVPGNNVNNCPEELDDPRPEPVAAPITTTVPTQERLLVGDIDTEQSHIFPPIIVDELVIDTTILAFCISFADTLTLADPLTDDVNGVSPLYKNDELS